MASIFLLVSYFSLLAFYSYTVNGFAEDTLSVNQSLQDGQTLVSSLGIFELGFFSPPHSDDRYVGIWYKQVPDRTVVWVANRNVPSQASDDVLMLTQDGNLVVLEWGNAIWSTNVSQARNPVAQLLDSGNLVIREEDDYEKLKAPLWQSFDHPTDTLLQGMKLGWNLRTGLDRYLTSWRNRSNPSTGKFKLGLDRHGLPQLTMWKRIAIHYRTGPWNGLHFSADTETKPNQMINFRFTSNAEELYWSFSIRNSSLVSRLVVDTSGVIQLFTRVDNNKSGMWNPYWFAPKDPCDHYKFCGAYGICNINYWPICKCPLGFKPSDPQEWKLRNGSGGCVRKIEFNCQKGDDGFSRLKHIKLPDTSMAFVNESMSLQECEEACRRNCSCTAYANSKVTGGGSGCLYWTSELIDLRVFPTSSQNLYLRVPSSLLVNTKHSGSHFSIWKSFSLLVHTFSVILVVLAFGCCFLWYRRTQERVSRKESQDRQFGNLVGSNSRESPDEYDENVIDLPQFDFSVIASATDNFSEANEIGKGGFGIVYKGQLEGQLIAVKRLSRSSNQGLQELKNEMMLIAKLQHRNLVQLLGYCISADEKMLIYEYMQGGSLDSLLFDNEKSSSLDWPKRLGIIMGIARGILYLHVDSRFRVIHRDLKASNILLDGEMNPKISDFGMARIFGENETQGNTQKVVGTYGYMSPEYALDGSFSVKSDVFSYGVLLLEIVSGKKNRGYYYTNCKLNLLAHAWRLWNQGKVSELTDEQLRGSCSASELLRCIQVGLLCVQEHPQDRPTMYSVVLMLGCEHISMPQPKPPGFGTESSSKREESAEQEQCSINEVTITSLECR